MTTERLDPTTEPAADSSRLAPDAAAQLREIAHELRNPLNALTAIMEIMKDERFGPLGNPRYVEYADLAHDAAARMIRLCDRLVLTRSEQEAAPRIRTGQLLDDVAAMYRPMAEARGLTLDVDLGKDLPDLAIDTETLTAIVSNLLTNAIKFTPSGGRVTLMARREPLENVAMFVISDTGIGLDAEELAQQMRPISNDTDAISTAGVHGDSGSGLGLAITRKAVAELGGTLELRSRKGVGTCAIVRLPLGLGATAA